MEAAVPGYAEGVLKSSVGKLGSFLLNEAWLIANVREDIISIRDELQSMDAVLRDLICARQLNQQNKIWMFHVLQVACDAELCIDEFIEILGGHCGHGFTGVARRAARFTSTVVPRWRIAKIIQELKVRAKELSERRARYSTTIQTNMLDTIELTRRDREASRQLLQNWHLMAEDELVGIDPKTRPRVTQLASNSGVTVIVGPAGSGKTALAKMVYRRRNDPNNGIQASAWVTLSNRPDDTKRVFKDVLRQVNCFHEDMEKCNEEELARNLKNHLCEKRFLLIFDSVWSSEEWKKIERGLPQSSRDTIVATTQVTVERGMLQSSRGTIVVTTQVMDVANAVNNGQNNIIKIDSEEESQFKFKGQERKDLCAKLLFNLTSETKSKYDTVMIMYWFVALVFHNNNKLLCWLSGVRSWLSEHITLHLGLIMVVWILILDQVLLALLNFVWTCLTEQHRNLTVVVLVLISFEDIRKWLRRLLGERQGLSMVTLFFISQQVLWNLCHGQVWLALTKAPYIIVLLFYDIICINLKAVLRNLGRSSFFVALIPVIFLYDIIYRVVSLLSNYVVAQVPRIVYKYLTRVKGIPLNMVHHYINLTSSRILGVHSLVPLEVKFICGALTCQRLDSNTVDKFFKKLDHLADNTDDKERLEEIIMTCYNLMSQSLKQCAQDLHKVLPVCHDVKRKKITRRWTARNFTSPKQGQTSEEVAECYFEELQRWGFIEPESIYPTGKTKTCRINNVFKAIDPTRLNYIEGLGETNLTQSNFSEDLGENQRTSYFTTNLWEYLQGEDVPTQSSDIPPDLTQSNSDENSLDNIQENDDPAQSSDSPPGLIQLTSDENSRVNIQGEDVLAQSSDIPPGLTQSNSDKNSLDNIQGDDVPAQSSDIPPSPTQLNSDENSLDNIQGDGISTQLFDIPLRYMPPSPSQSNSDENSQDNIQGDDVPIELTIIPSGSTQLSDYPIYQTQLSSTENYLYHLSYFTTYFCDYLQEKDVPAQSSDVPPDSTQLKWIEFINSFKELFGLLFQLLEPYFTIFTINLQHYLKGENVPTKSSDIPLGPTQSNLNENSQDNIQGDGVLAKASDFPLDPSQLISTENSQGNSQTNDVSTQSSVILPDQTQLISDESFQLFGIPPSTVHELFRKHLGIKYSESLIILDLEGCKSLNKTELGFLCMFVKLRFLSLRNTDITVVPPNLRKLKQLETLDIRQTQIRKVAKDILHLKNLKHLLAGYFYKPDSITGDFDTSSIRSIELPVRMEEMTNLETLAYVNATRASNLLISVRELTRLKKLGLVIQEGNLNSRPLCISLMMLSDSLRSLLICDERERDSLDFLEYLCFPPCNLNSLTLNGYLGRLPQWISNHKLLCKLTLANTILNSNAIRLIGKIPTLLCLKLYRDSYNEYSLNLKMDEFAVLKVLIIHCHAIRMISFEKGTTTKLEVFRWVFSKAQTGEVCGIENLPMLKEVSLIGDIDAVLEKNIKEAVVKHSNWKSTLVFEKIEKKILDSNDSNA